jgi:hypothetical protein
MSLVLGARLDDPDAEHARWEPLGARQSLCDVAVVAVVDVLVE